MGRADLTQDLQLAVLAKGCSFQDFRYLAPLQSDDDLDTDSQFRREAFGGGRAQLIWARRETCGGVFCLWRGYRPHCTSPRY